MALPLTQPRAATPPAEASGAAPRGTVGRKVREFTFAGLVLVYAVLTVSIVVYPSPMLDLDKWWLDRHLWGYHPQFHGFIYYFVMVGQRGPATLALLPLFGWIAWRRRSTEPLVMLGTGLLLLNASVGVVKYAVGRVGPRDSSDVHQIFTSGTLFPSGHVSNTVVLYGVLALVLPRFGKWLWSATVFLSLTVGIGTIYLRTHWFSDVIGGWIAGALVLVALPEVMPFAQRCTDRAVAAVRRWQAERRRTAARRGGLARPLPAGARPMVGTAPSSGQR